MEPGPVFIPALTTNHFFSSLLPLLPLAPAASPSSVLSSSVTASAAGSNPVRLRSTQTFYHFDFNGTFPITTTPVRFTRPEVHTLPTFPERRSSWPQRDGRSTTLPRSSTTTRPPLSHTLSLYISLCLSLGPHGRPLVPLLLLTISSISTTAVSIRPPFAQSFILVAPTISVLFTDNFGPLLRIVISLATI